MNTDFDLDIEAIKNRYLKRLEASGTSLLGFEHNGKLPFRCGTLLFVHTENLVGCKTLDEMCEILRGQNLWQRSVQVMVI